MVDAGVAIAGIIMLMFGMFYLFFFLIWILFAVAMLVGFVLWILMIIDAVQRKFPNENDKVLWIIILVFIGIPGAILYYLMVKSKDKKTKASAKK
ncbi:MAG: PLDc N-terminal domain-containing protein [archaeon]